MERDFHTSMTQTLLNAFLDNCSSDTRTQLLLNTHDLMLMDQKLFRKDEIFVVDRDKDDVSHLTSWATMEEFVTIWISVRVISTASLVGCRKLTDENSMRPLNQRRNENNLPHPPTIQSTSRS